MGRPRTGSLVHKPGGFAARLSTAGGRAWVGLGTHNEDEAKQKLKLLVEDTSKAEEPMETYADTWLRQRKAAGVVMYREEYTYWKLHVRPLLGSLKLIDVRPEHVVQVLDQLVRKGKSKQTVRHVKGFMHRMFADAWRANRIEANPVDRVKLPKIREQRKERVILTDDEFSKFITCPDIDEEIRMLSLCSRVLGGARTGDLHRLDWALLDVPSFESVIIARNKTGTPQRLGVPEAIRPFVRKWWEGQGCPSAGPVFPSQRGDRKGKAKGTGSSYAKKLRRELRRAGITRPELFTETQHTRRVDFHSFRRAFVGALAGAGVPLQVSMKLSGHTNARTHTGYIVGVQEIPPAVVPVLDPGAKTQEEVGTPEGIRTPDQRLRRPASPNDPAGSPETSGTPDPLPSRLVAALGDDPELLARVLAKLLK